jgi:exportin-1
MAATTMAEQAAKLLDFTQRLDINLLDSVVACMYTGMGEQVNC